MEGISSSERIVASPYAEMGERFNNRIREFERTETFYETPADAVFGFAEYIRNESAKVLKFVQEHTEGRSEEEQYRLEHSAAKLAEFNEANAAVLHRYAELLGNYPESVGPLEDSFPWLREISAWASDYTQKQAV